MGTRRVLGGLPRPWPAGAAPPPVDGPGAGRAITPPSFCQAGVGRPLPPGPMGEGEGFRGGADLGVTPCKACAGGCQFTSMQLAPVRRPRCRPRKPRPLRRPRSFGSFGLFSPPPPPPPPPRCRRPFLSPLLASFWSFRRSSLVAWPRAPLGPPGPPPRPSRSRLRAEPRSLPLRPPHRFLPFLMDQRTRKK